MLQIMQHALQEEFPLSHQEYPVRQFLFSLILTNLS
jgi:hypothetical protein